MIKDYIYRQQQAHDWIIWQITRHGWAMYELAKDCSWSLLYKSTKTQLLLICKLLYSLDDMKIHVSVMIKRKISTTKLGTPILTFIDTLFLAEGAVYFF
jgi:hypothetical protein